MKNAIKAIAITLGAIWILLIGVLATSAALYTPGYIFRVVMNGESKITDYHIFPERVITRSAAPYSYSYVDPVSPDVVVIRGMMILAVGSGIAVYIFMSKKDSAPIFHKGAADAECS